MFRSGRWSDEMQTQTLQSSWVKRVLQYFVVLRQEPPPPPSKKGNRRATRFGMPKKRSCFLGAVLATQVPLLYLYYQTRCNMQLPCTADLQSGMRHCAVLVSIYTKTSHFWAPISNAVPPPPPNNSVINLMLSRGLFFLLYRARDLRALLAPMPHGHRREYIR